jgi:sulfate adenylyltransferase (ADP) / ATP adenylyltransferase
MLEKKSDRDLLPLRSRNLWEKTVKQTQHALECGALHSISTDYQFIEQNNINFFVRILSNLVRKDKAQKLNSQKEINPFLPYEQDLFVADLSETHLCILNKYNVVPHHLLIITRVFEEQESWLNIRDFEALWTTLQEIDGLAFYNGGKAAGASQRHKHLQLIPFPFIPENASIPIKSAITSAQFHNSLGILPALPFVHAFAKFTASLANPATAATIALECYQRLLEAVGLPVSGDRQKGVYNLLMTREWMLIVPRSQESYASIAVNSLGFAGAMLVRNQQQLDLLRQQGPLEILKNVAFFREKLE